MSTSRVLPETGHKDDIFAFLLSQKFDRLLVQHSKENALWFLDQARPHLYSILPRHRSLLHFNSLSHGSGGEKCTRTYTHTNNIRSSTYSPGLFMADRGNSVGSRFDKQAFKFRWSLQNREPCMGGGCVGIRLLKSSFVHWYFLEAIEWTSVTSGDVLCLHARVRCRKIARSCLQGLKGWALN